MHLERGAGLIDIARFLGRSPEELACRIAEDAPPSNPLAPRPKKVGMKNTSRPVPAKGVQQEQNGGWRILPLATSREIFMRTFLVATALSVLAFVPSGAFAQSNGSQTTETQQTFKDGVKAQPRTEKRDNIIRSETNKNETSGAAPMKRDR
jgi:hypothetical protein